MLGHRPMTVEDYLKILRRRAWILVVPAIVISAAAYGVSLKLPDRYTSQTLVLVAEQRVPDAIVKSVVTGDLNERLSSMQEQILSSTRLRPIVERFNLFGDSLAMEDKVNQLRGAIRVTAVEPMAQTQASHLPGFRVAVTLSSPSGAQAVCAQITSMFLEENLRNREQRAESTTDFLAKQLDDAKQRLDEQDTRLADFKQRNIGAMPDEAQTNLNLLTSANTQLETANEALARAQQNKTFLESMIAEQLKSAQQSEEGHISTDTLNRQLQELERDLVQLEAKYTDNHPDVVKQKAEIEQLKKRIANEESAHDKSADAPLSISPPNLPAKDGPVGSRAVKESADSITRNEPAGTGAKTAGTDPPQLRQLRTELFLAEQEIRQRTKQQETLQSQIGNYERRVQLSPVIEEQYKQLTRDHQDALDFYNDLLKKRDASAMATDLERRQEGEEFEILDPASLPTKPSFPNRPQIAAGGAGAGLALGIGVIALLEFRDKALSNEGDIDFFLRVSTLAVVPVIKTISNRKARFTWPPWRAKKTLQASR